MHKRIYFSFGVINLEGVLLCAWLVVYCRTPEQERNC